MRARSAARRLSPARSRAASPASKPAWKTPSISATSGPSATGAMRGIMSRACTGYCRRMRPTISCWRPARPVRCASSSNWRLPRSAAPSNGAARASTKPGSTKNPAKPWSGSIRSTSGRPKSIFWSAMPARRARSSAGSPRPRSPNWSRKWSQAISMTQGGRWPVASLPFELKGKTVYVAGHRGMVGSALVRRLASENVNLLTATRSEADLRDQAAVNRWFAVSRPQVVFLAAAKVGGIVANNTLRAEFLYDNLAIATNVIHAAHAHGVEKLLFLGSSCIYPKLAPQPLREDCMLTGLLEPTNEPYAIAKIAGIKMVEAYRSQYGADFINVMPTNLYGRGDNYHLEYSHIVAALIRRFHEAKMSGAKEVVVWGTGTPRREFLYVDDLADACIHLMKTYSSDELVNIGTGEDITIAEFARVVAATVGYAGEISFDPSRPGGTPRKLLDVSRLAKLGWRAATPLKDGIRLAYQAYTSESKQATE